MFLRRQLIAVVLFLASSGASRAACVYKPFEFFPDRNDGVIVGAVIQKGTNCQHRFKEGKGYHFTSVAPDVKPPMHGELKKVGDNEFYYTPQPDFVGDDVYAFKICAVKGRKQGCSFVAFEAHVVEAQNKPKPSAKAPADQGCAFGPPDRVIPVCGAVIDAAGRPPDQRAKALKWRGLAYFRAGDLDRSAADFAKAAVLDPKDFEPLNNLGLIAQSKGDYDKAIAYYDKANDLLPGQAPTLFNRANAWRLKGNYANAVADATQVIAAKPGFTGAYKVRGLAREAQKDFDGAIADFSKVLEIWPQDAESLTARGDAYKAKGDTAHAEADHAAAKKAAPGRTP